MLRLSKMERNRLENCFRQDSGGLLQEVMWLFSMDISDSDWLLGGEMGMECDLIRAEHKPRSRGFVQGGENVGDWSATHRLANWTSGRLCLEKDSPFDRLDIADTSVLEKSRERQNCGSCNRSRKFFCYSCCCALPSMESSTPCLDLPIRWTNWFERVQGHRFANHYQKLFSGWRWWSIMPRWTGRALQFMQLSLLLHLSRSTPILTSRSIILMTPSWSSPAKIAKVWSIFLRIPRGRAVTWRKRIALSLSLLLCLWIALGTSAMGSAKTQGEFLSRMKIRNTVQRHEIDHHIQRLSALPRVELEPRQTMFWRHQKGKPREYLATIEV